MGKLETRRSNIGTKAGGGIDRDYCDASAAKPFKMR